MIDRAVITKEEVAKGYDAIVDKVGLESRFYDDCIAIQKRYRGKILDVGCGRGFLLEKVAKVAEQGSEFFGLDISPKLVALAKERNPSADIIVGDAEAMPYPDATFDTVFMTEALEHMLDFAKALREVSRVLKPGGTFIVTVPNRDWLRYEFYDKMRNHELQPVDDHYFRYNEVTGLLANAHFTIAQYRGLDNLYYYGWKHRIEELIALVAPALNRKMKRLIFLCVKSA